MTSHAEADHSPDFEPHIEHDSRSAGESAATGGLLKQQNPLNTLFGVADAALGLIDSGQGSSRETTSRGIPSTSRTLAPRLCAKLI
jgi:hypothetical protein